MIKTYGQVVYDSYKRVLDSTGLEDSTAPEWEELNESKRVAFEAGAKAAVHNWRHGPECTCPDSRPTGLEERWY